MFRLLINRHFSDLNPVDLGHEVCSPQKAMCGPEIRDYTLIHCVAHGKGYFCCQNVTYEVHEGEAFLILPGMVTSYYPDPEDPWEYEWIGFDGKLSERFSTLPPVFPLSTKWAEEMLAVCMNGDNPEFLVASVLFRMYAELFEAPKPRSLYIHQVKNYIRTMYMRDIRIADIAEQMNLDRRYLSRLFKERVGETIQDYLISVRMEKAKEYLSGGTSVNEVAKLCGYGDISTFSKFFKRRCGVSPGKWKATREQEEQED